MIESADGAQGLAFVVDAAGKNCIAYHRTADEAHSPRFVYGSPEALVRETGRLLKSLGFDEQEGPYWAARHRLQEVS
ncbi:hypothetical protein WMF38_57360 [Sorangium sp. So ce118]